MERRYERSAPAGPAPRRELRTEQAVTPPSDDDTLLIGGALALLAVAASSGLLLAQATRLQRDMGAR